MKKSILSLLVSVGLIGIASAQTPVGDLTNGLVGFYQLNGNANDSSGNGNNGTVYGATPTTDQFGNLNGAMSFNGISDYVDCGSLIPNYENATLSVWALVRSDAAHESGIIAKPRYTWGTGLEIRANDYNQNAVGVGYNNWNDNIALLTTNATPLNQWHNYVATAGNGVLAYYLDGVLVSHQNFTFQNISSPYDLVIGAGTSGYNSLSGLGIWSQCEG